ncbi:hypothetical protein [Streptomyces sp. 4F14]|uniref:hypothetical protein n=1 Tax=Streptomyces sp. 4F14 TaxID=3394380 RepID=UPI003A8B7268
MSHIARKASAVLLAACGTLGIAVAAPASAADYPTDSFFVSKTDGSTTNSYTSGTITWYNRTAGITGAVVDLQAGAYTVAYFEAFAGATKIDSQTRSANDESDLGQRRTFTFTIGDSDLVGGIDRVKVTVCTHYPSATFCSAPENYSRG